MVEMGDVPKRGHPDQRAENSPRLQMGLQHSEKSQIRRWVLAGPETKMCPRSVNIDVTLDLKTYNWPKIVNYIQD